MPNAFERISTEYSARADIVSRGGWPGLDVGLKRWFQVLDSEPEIKAIVVELQNSFDYQSWSNGAKMDAERTGRIDFPVEDPKCTALRLAMFRAFSHDENQAMHAARHVFRITGSGPPVIIPQLLSTHFNPLVFDLRKLILARLTGGEAPPETVTWRDEVILLPADAAFVVDLRDKMSELLEELRKVNERLEPELFNRKLHEITAGYDLVGADSVRGKLLGDTVDAPLRWFIAKFGDVGVGVLSNLVYAILKRHFALP